MDEITQKIAEYSSAATFSDLTDESAHAATQRLIDSLGCAIGAYDCEPAQIGRRLAAGQVPGKYPGYVLCFGDRLPAESATFINSAMIRNFDFNDRYPGGHPSDCLGALLALAGAMKLDGKEFLTGMIVVYEIFARLSDATMLSRHGWDQGYAIGIATEAAVCNLLRLPIESTAHAVGIAAASNLPLRVTRSGELTSWKNVATAYAARNGLFAALLAAEGMAGPGNAFEGRNGLWEKVTGPFELAPFPNQGGAYLTPRVQLKYWPIETNGLRPRDLTSCQSPADLRRLAVIGPERTTKRIDQPLRSRMHALLGQVVELRGSRVFSYFVGDAIHFMCSVTWSW